MLEYKHSVWTYRFCSPHCVPSAVYGPRGLALHVVYLGVVLSFGACR